MILAVKLYGMKIVLFRILLAGVLGATMGVLGHWGYQWWGWPIPGSTMSTAIQAAVVVTLIEVLPRTRRQETQVKQDSDPRT